MAMILMRQLWLVNQQKALKRITNNYKQRNLSYKNKTAMNYYIVDFKQGIINFI